MWSISNAWWSRIHGYSRLEKRGRGSNCELGKFNHTRRQFMNLSIRWWVVRSFSFDQLVGTKLTTGQQLGQSEKRNDRGRRWIKKTTRIHSPFVRSGPFYFQINFNYLLYCSESKIDIYLEIFGIGSDRARTWPMWPWVLDLTFIELIFQFRVMV